MNTQILKTVGNFIIKHKNILLGVVGVTGVVATGVTAAKAGYEYAKDENDGKYDNLDKIDKYKHEAKKAIVPAGAAVITIASIVATHKVHAKELAALGGAYTLLQKRYGSLKNAVSEISDNEILKEIKKKVQDDEITIKDASDCTQEEKLDKVQALLNNYEHYDWHPDDDGLYYDTLSGRYFPSSATKLAEAEAEFNERLCVSGCGVPLNELYGMIDSEDLAENLVGWHLGWDIMRTSILKMHFTKRDGMTVNDGFGNMKPCYTIDYISEPICLDFDSYDL